MVLILKQGGEKKEGLEEGIKILNMVVRESLRRWHLSKDIEK